MCSLPFSVFSGGYHITYVSRVCMWMRHCAICASFYVAYISYHIAVFFSFALFRSTLHQCYHLWFLSCASVTIECPDDMLTQRNSLLMYTSPTCTETGTGVTSGSSCSRQSPLFILSSDLAVTCTCEFYQMVQCTFMVIVEREYMRILQTAL